MALRNILKDTDETLRRTCRPVMQFDKRLHQLLDDMAETMYNAKGCGLAANQVGVLRRVVTIDTGEKLIELVNPEIIAKKGRQEEVEGCLSFPGEYYVTRRPFWVKVRAQDRNGDVFEVQGEGLTARAFCHELDHLDGVLYMDKMLRKINVRKANVNVRSNGTDASPKSSNGTSTSQKSNGADQSKPSSNGMNSSRKSNGMDTSRKSSNGNRIFCTPKDSISG